MFLPATLEQLLYAGRSSDDRGACVEHEAVLLVDVGTPTGLVPRFEDHGRNSGGLQSDRRTQPAETATDHRRAARGPMRSTDSFSHN